MMMFVARRRVFEKSIAAGAGARSSVLAKTIPTARPGV